MNTQYPTLDFQLPIADCQLPNSSPQGHKGHKGRKGHIIFRFGDLEIWRFYDFKNFRISDSASSPQAELPNFSIIFSHEGAKASRCLSENRDKLRRKVFSSFDGGCSILRELA
jgi:hypothetical protein